MYKFMNVKDLKMSSNKLITLFLSMFGN